MMNWTFPTSPFVYYYDSEYDIKRRAQRAKRKVQELQEAGLLPMQPERFHDVEEHHKKRKTLWKEHRKSHGEKKPHKTQPWTDKNRGKKHKRNIQRSHDDTEKNFPREPRTHSPKTSKKARTKHFNSTFHTQGSSAGNDGKLLESTKKKKRKKKLKNERDESLFLIKQRKKKKSKQ
uniref:Uncharacterized protein n=1 Tax=Sphenodon punctatus TaxID=8508 RepID=A0A8D0GZS5_SPHPU